MKALLNKFVVSSLLKLTATLMIVMHSQPTYALVTCLISICSAIRVDFNTNKGPIVPPTPRPTVRPVLPYREPAPVWEDQSNDIPNPNTYSYILPPPSRPRSDFNNIASPWERPSHDYGNLLLPSDVNTLLQQGNTDLGSGTLAAKYIPNVGIRYTSVVAPLNNKGNNNNNKNYYNPNNGGSYYYGYDKKLNGKYNEKTKKYKAYEKVKYVPQNNFPHLELALPIAKPHTSIFNQDQLIRTQHLPYPDPQVTFRSFNKVTTKSSVNLDTSTSAAATTAVTTGSIISSATTTKPKFAHEKDQILTKSKFNSLKLPNISSNINTAVVGHKASAILSMKSR